MLLDNSTSILINNSNIKHYENLGYNLKLDHILYVFVKDLSRGSHKKIPVKCDFCGIEKEIEYCNLLKNNYLEIYKCSKCKREETLLEKYGVKNVFQINEIKRRIKKSNKINNGCDYPSQNLEIQEKIKKTKEKSDKNKIQERRKNTCIEKYNVDNISKLDIIKENKSYKKFNVKFISQIENFDLITNNHKIKTLNLRFKTNIKGIDDHNYYIECSDCKKIIEISQKDFHKKIGKCKSLCNHCNKELESNENKESLIDFIKINYGKNIIMNSTDIIYPYNIMMYLPDLKLGFEYNDLSKHNENKKSKNYHLIKTEFCEKKEIQLIHIYEDDWITKKEIVKSRILNILGRNSKIYSEYCTIKELNYTETKKFLDENHIQGHTISSINIGLYNKEGLCSVMIFGKKRIVGNSLEYEILRFCNKNRLSVVGSSEKLLSYFINKYNPNKLITYIDRSWSQGELYKNNNFILTKKLEPDYYYVVNGIRKNKYHFKKNILVAQGFDKEKSEHSIMLERKIYRIYNSGYLKFVWTSKNKNEYIEIKSL